MKTRWRKPLRWTARWPQACLAAALVGLAAITAFSGAHAQGREARHDAQFGSPHWVLDSRFHHDRYYPSRGYHVTTLPTGSVAVRFGSDRFFFQSGVWFRPAGREFVVVTPPFGVVVPALPPGCIALDSGHSTYYYANGIYYANAVGTPGYVVVAPPPNVMAAAVQSPPPAPVTPPPDAEPIAYPRNGQSQAQMFSDRADCARWAVGQSGYEPTLAEADPARLPNYRRAESACLEGRGYTVR